MFLPPLWRRSGSRLERGTPARGEIEGYTFELAGEDVHITLSFGVAEFSPQDRDHSEIIKNAHYAVYKAKSSGRNRVVVYPSDNGRSGGL